MRVLTPFTLTMRRQRWLPRPNPKQLTLLDRPQDPAPPEIVEAVLRGLIIECEALREQDTRR